MVVPALFVEMWLKDDSSVGFQFLTRREFIAWSGASDFRYSFLGRAYHVYVCTDDVPRARALALVAQVIARGRVVVRTVNLAGSLEVVSHVVEISEITSFLEGNRV